MEKVGDNDSANENAKNILLLCKNASNISRKLDFSNMFSP